jgi:hypothetical protein
MIDSHFDHVATDSEALTFEVYARGVDSLVGA